MDSFVKQFFEGVPHPTITAVSDNGNFVTGLRGLLKVEGLDALQTRKMTMNQGQTWLGKVEAHLTPGSTDFDGINKMMLTTEGSINLEKLQAHVKIAGGLQAQPLSANYVMMNSWQWRDNHVALLTNALRYVALRGLTDATYLESEVSSYPEYNDGHVRIDRNQYWPPYYRAAGRLNWVDGTNGEDYPMYDRIDTFCPSEGVDAVDLRGLTEVGAEFILLMLGKWRRRSRYALDFDTPMLTGRVTYRYNRELGRLSELDITQKDYQQIPMISHGAAWEALKVYVTRNRLYNQFSTALWLVTAAASRFIPSTAEGTIWLDDTWHLSIPKFSSVRGRYTCLNEDEGAFISNRALSEWSFINADIERIYMIAMIFGQCAQTGLASRCLRLGMTTDVNDIYETEEIYMKHENFFSAAASEGCNRQAPMPGLPGAACYTLTDYYSTAEEKVVATLNESDDDLTGYDSRKVDQHYVVWFYRYTMAGVPTFLLPVDIGGLNTPFSLSGEINNMAGENKVIRQGWRTDLVTAWHAAWLNRVCGYDSEVRDDGFDGSHRFFAPNENSWTWPVLADIDRVGEPVLFTKFKTRRNEFISLPSMHRRMAQPIKWRLVVAARYVSMSGYNSDRYEIEECSPRTYVSGTIDKAFKTPQSIVRLRGNIVRSQQGFRFEEPIQPGLIPPSEQIAVGESADQDQMAE